MRIKLSNRDGASLYLYRNDNAEPIDSNIYEWELTVDSKHKYVLEYCRFIGAFSVENNKVNWSTIEEIDPSGGPFISLGDEFEFLKLNEEKEWIKMSGKIVKISSINNIWISERINDNQEYIK